MSFADLPRSTRRALGRQGGVARAATGLVYITREKALAGARKGVENRRERRALGLARKWRAGDEELWQRALRLAGRGFTP